MKRKDWWFWIRFGIWFFILAYLAIAATLGTIAIVDICEGHTPL